MLQVKVTDSLRQGDKLDGILKVMHHSVPFSLPFCTVDMLSNKTCPNSNIVVFTKLFYWSWVLWQSDKKPKTLKTKFKNLKNIFVVEVYFYVFKPEKKKMIQFRRLILSIKLPAWSFITRLESLDSEYVLV